MSTVELAVIGGSGLYDMEGLTNVVTHDLDTPFGKPSDMVRVGQLNGRSIAFLPRHGRGHRLNPSEVPYRANIFALKQLGVKYLVAVNACGSLRADYAPGHIAIPDQLFDQTKGIRPHTFFENGLVAHISVANPLCPQLSHALTQAARATDGTVHEGGNFIIIEGPRFSTKGESHTYRRWGMDLIGMTSCPEAFLAAEAEIAYASMAHITDYDVWHESEQPVTVEMVIRTLLANTKLAQQAIANLVADMENWAGDFPAHHALRDALITDRTLIPNQLKQTLAPLVASYLD